MPMILVIVLLVLLLGSGGFSGSQVGTGHTGGHHEIRLGTLVIARSFPDAGVVCIGT
jgi:hypothetical protein